VSLPHIAIVDDDESVCRSVSRLLRQVNMQATAFQSVQEFLACPLRGTFTCLVLDVQLGAGMTGFGLRQLLLEQGDRTPVIFLTAYDDPQTQAEAKRLESAIIRKGADPLSLIEAIRRAKRREVASVTSLHSRD
jgi:FixJ family two-component response regulator